MKGVRTSDNCYGIIPNSQYSCNSVKSDVADLWHQRLGHVNHRNLSKISKKEVLMGLPEFGEVEFSICGPCQLEKQVIVAHNNTTVILTKQPLKLLHLNLRRSSKTKSLGERKYIFIVVDDFTKYCWEEFLRENSEGFDLVSALCKKLQNE